MLIISIVILTCIISIIIIIKSNKLLLISLLSHNKYLCNTIELTELINKIKEIECF